MDQFDSSPSSPPPVPAFEFTAKADGYVPRNAYWLASCARLAYERRDEIEKQTKEWGLTEFRFLGQETPGVESAVGRLGEGEGWAVLESLKGTQGFVAGNDEVVIVCFRGTEGVADFLADAAAMLVAPSWSKPPDLAGGERREWGNVHQGFDTALNKPVRQELLDAVGELAKTGQGIWVSGHSLGGALATLAAAELTQAGHEVQGVYTFGQPRVGDPVFAKAYDENPKLGGRHFRFVNNNDLVTEAPLERVKIKRLALDYKHVGQRIYIKSTGDLTDDISTFALSLDRAAGVAQSAAEGDYADGLSDHKMVNYVTALAQNYKTDPTA